jgi:hypothetical protein
MAPFPTNRGSWRFGVSDEDQARLGTGEARKGKGGVTRKVLIEAGYNAVWVNDENGCCIGRFGRMGVDVHRPITDPDYEKKGECLVCTHGPVTRRDWATFVTAMRAGHGVTVPEEFQPAWLRLDPITLAQFEGVWSQIYAAMLRPGMYAGEQGCRGDMEWKHDAVKAVLFPTSPVVDMDVKKSR